MCLICFCDLVVPFSGVNSVDHNVVLQCQSLDPTACGPSWMKGWTDKRRDGNKEGREGGRRIRADLIDYENDPSSST